MKNNIKLHILNKRHLALIFVCIAVIMAIGGYWYYGQEKERIKQASESTIAVIARLKTDRIETWYKDELLDVQLIAGHVFLIETVNKYIETDSEEGKNNLSDFLNQIKAVHDFHEVFITSSGDDMIASGRNMQTEISATELKMVAQAIATGKSVSTGLFQAVVHGNESISSPTFQPLR